MLNLVFSLPFSVRLTVLCSQTEMHRRSIPGAFRTSGLEGWPPSCGCLLSPSLAPTSANPSPLLHVSNCCFHVLAHGSCTLYISTLDLLPLPTLTLAIPAIFMASTLLSLCKELLKCSFTLQVHNSNCLLGIFPWIANQQLTLTMSTCKCITFPHTSSSFRHPCFGDCFPNHLGMSQGKGVGVVPADSLLLAPRRLKSKESASAMLVTSGPFFPTSLLLLKSSYLLPGSLTAS